MSNLRAAIMRGRGVKRDANEPVIVAGLEKVGWYVTQLSAEGFPDLHLVKAGRKELLECKMPGEGLTAKQEIVFAELGWRGVKIHIAHSLDEALRLLGEIR